MSKFFSDFFGSVADNAGISPSTSPDVAAASGDSYGTTAGNAFYAVLNTVAHSKNVKQAVIDRVAQTPTAQAYAAQQKTAYVQGLLRNPVLWGVIVVGALIIGYAGFAWGKR